VSEDHAATAVALEAYGVEGFGFFHFALGNEPDVSLPEVARDLAAGEATDGNDHCGKAREC